MVALAQGVHTDLEEALENAYGLAEAVVALDRQWFRPHTERRTRMSFSSA